MDPPFEIKTESELIAYRFLRGHALLEKESEPAPVFFLVESESIPVNWYQTEVCP